MSEKPTCRKHRQAEVIVLPHPDKEGYYACTECINRYRGGERVRCVGYLKWVKPQYLLRDQASQKASILQYFKTHGLSLPDDQIDLLCRCYSTCPARLTRATKLQLSRLIDLEPGSKEGMCQEEEDERPSALGG